MAALRFLAWNVHGINNETPTHIADDIADMLELDKWHLAVFVEAPQTGKKFWKNFITNTNLENYYVKHEGQTVCIANKKIFKGISYSSLKTKFNFTHQPVVWILELANGQKIRVIAVHLKAEGKVSG